MPFDFDSNLSASQNVEKFHKQSKAHQLNDGPIWSVVESSAKEIGIERFGTHDLRRTCAKLCRKNGGDLERIKFLLGAQLDPDD